MSNITDDDINILKNQGNLSLKDASELLVLNKGDLIESLLQVQSDNFDLNLLKKNKEIEIDEETDDFIVDTSKQENLVKYREIVDSKDEIYNRKKKEKEEKERKIKEGIIDEETHFSQEELYKLKRGNNKFNVIHVL